MISRTVMYLFNILVFGLLMNNAVNAGGKGKGKCDGEDFNKPESTERKDAMASCYKELGIKEKKDIETTPCFEPCKLTKLGVFVDNSLNLEGAEKMIKMFPDSKHKVLKDLFEECGNSTQGAFSMEDDCASFQGFLTCYKTGLRDICKWKKQCDKSDN